MGRAMLLLSVGLVAIFSIVQQSLHQKMDLMAERSAKYSSDSQARNSASGAAEMAVKKISENSDWWESHNPHTFSLPYTSGTVSFEDSDDDPNLGENQIRITSVASLQNQQATVKVVIEESGGGPIPPIPAPFGFYTQEELDFEAKEYSSRDGGSNNFSVSGHDKNLDGSNGPGESLPGIALGGSDSHSSMMSSLTNDQKNNTDGKEGTPSVEQVSMDATQLSDYITAWEDNAHRSVNDAEFESDVTWGTSANPEISVVDGRTEFQGNVTGTGILLVKSHHIEFKENLDWDGLVIFDVGSDVDLEIKNNLNVQGSMLFASEKKVEFKEDVEVQYSSEALSLAEMAAGSISLGGDGYEVVKVYE